MERAFACLNFPGGKDVLLLTSDNETKYHGIDFHGKVGQADTTERSKKKMYIVSNFHQVFQGEVWEYQTHP